MKKIITSVFLLSVLFSCTNKNKGDESSVDQPTAAVNNFLIWYRDHIDTMITIGLVNQDMKDSADFYSVNFTETERYLAELKNSGLVSDKYLNDWRNYFKKADEQFKITHQNEGPPEGFDFDLIMWSQDFDLAEIEKVKTLEALNGDHATVTVEFPYHYKLQYSLSKQNDKWLIDEIKNISAN